MVAPAMEPARHDNNKTHERNFKLIGIIISEHLTFRDTIKMFNHPFQKCSASLD